MDKEQLRQLKESGRELLEGQFAPETLNPESRTVDIVWFTGIDVPRLNYWTGEQYILRFDPKGCDLSNLNNGAPVLDSHCALGAESQKGVVERATVESPTRYTATIRFSRRPDVEPIWQDVEDKIIQKFSMGTEILEKTEIPPTKGETMRVVLATKWRPYELSIAPIPADFGTTTLAAQHTADTGASAPTKEPLIMAENLTAAEAITPEPVNLEAIAKEAALLERNRSKQIRLRGAQLKLDPEFTESLVNNGSSIEAATTAIFDELARRGAAEPQTLGHHTAIVRDEVDTRRVLMGSVLAHKMNPSCKVEDQNDFRSLSLQELARECIEASGQRVRGLGKPQIAELAMQQTSDFPLILENSARKAMISTYELTPVTYRQWAVGTTTPDFKTMSRYDLSATPGFLTVREGAQITVSSMTEKREQYALSTAGRGISFTRQMIINDDLGAFGKLVMQFGEQAAVYENRTVYAILTANATLSDSIALFYATHNNLGTGVIANTGLDAMFTAMSTQKDLDGVTLRRVIPTYLIVPAAKAATARNAMVAVGPSVKIADQNWFAGMLTVVSEPELDANSSVVWYAAAGGGKSGIEYCHLEGANGPQMIRKDNEDGVLGMTLYGYLDFGAKAVDYRGVYKSSGA